jgi:hypothetical protein
MVRHKNFEAIHAPDDENYTPDGDLQTVTPEGASLP